MNNSAYANIQRQNAGVIQQPHKNYNSQQNTDSIGISRQQSLTEQHQLIPAQPQPLEPTVQIQVQPLIKPATRNQPVQAVAPIIYSFGQTDFSNKLYAKENFNNINTNNNNQINSGRRFSKRISWGNGDFDYEDDDFGDILG